MTFPNFNEIVFFLAFGLSSLANAYPLLPELTSPFSLGITSFELINYATSRCLMVSIFCPAADPGNCKQYLLSLDISPPFAQIVSEQYCSPFQSIANLTARAHLNVPMKSPSFPVIFYSPGYGGSHLEYTCTVGDIASLGYIDVAIDHLDDTFFIEYLNGTVAIYDPVDYDNTTVYVPFVNNHVSDIRFALDSFSNDSFASQIPGFSSFTTQGRYKGNDGFDTNHIGVLGHSLGGASEASTMLADPHFVTGINIDGSMIGSVASVGLSSPFILVSSAVHNRSTDPS